MDMCVLNVWVKGRQHSQVGGDGVPFPLPHRQHEVGNPEHRARLVLIVCPMLLCQLQLDQRRDGRLSVCRSDLGHRRSPGQGLGAISPNAAEGGPS